MRSVKLPLLAAIIIIMLPLIALATGEEINWQVISGGGSMDGSSTNHRLSGTIGQTAVGEGGSTNYGLKHGFWQVFGGGTGNCCLDWGTPGDANKDNSVNLTDILNAISYVYVDPLGEPQAADGCNALYDVNGDGTTVENPNINLTDILNMISHVYVEPLGEPILCCPPGCLTP